MLTKKLPDFLQPAAKLYADTASGKKRVKEQNHF